MALLRTMLVVMLCLTFFMYLAGYQTMFSSMMSGGGSFVNIIKDNFNAVLLGGGALVALGLFSFPNPYIIFAALAYALLNFFTFPVQLFQEMSFPAEMRIFIIAIFQLFYLLGVIEFFKGGET